MNNMHINYAPFAFPERAGKQIQRIPQHVVALQPLPAQLVPRFNPVFVASPVQSNAMPVPSMFAHVVGSANMATSKWACASRCTFVNACVRVFGEDHEACSNAACENGCEGDGLSGF